MTAPGGIGRYQFAEPQGGCVWPVIPIPRNPALSSAILASAAAWYGESPIITRRADDMHVCVFTHCPGHDDKQDVVIHALQELAADSVVIKRYLRTVITKEGTIMTDVTTLTADFDKYKGDVSAAFTRLEASVAAAGGIPADVQTAIDALDAEINGADADANAEDPAPVVTPPADGGDGSGDVPPAE
jgi:hypothetical protein